jgi:HK97 gp10 family phage protein
VIDIEIEGIEELERALEDAAKKLHAAFEEAVAESSEALAESARSFAPVDTGRLRDAIVGESDGTTGEVFVDGVDYASYVEFGTSKMVAQPFLTPAAEIEREQFVRRLSESAEGAV